MSLTTMAMWFAWIGLDFDFSVVITLIVCDNNISEVLVHSHLAPKLFDTLGGVFIVHLLVNTMVWFVLMTATLCYVFRICSFAGCGCCDPHRLPRVALHEPLRAVALAGLAAAAVPGHPDFSFHGSILTQFIEDKVKFNPQLLNYFSVKEAEVRNTETRCSNGSNVHS